VRSFPLPRRGRSTPRTATCAAPSEYQLAYFRGLDRVTPEEMTHLQMEIARLHPTDRTAMLRELTRAINSGEIKGFP
jgi:hypothetical protein